MHGFCTVFARFQGMQWALWLAKYDKGCRNYWAENYDALHKNDVNSKLLKSEWLARWALLIRGPGIRVPSWDFLFIRHLHGLCTVFARSAFFMSDGVSPWITLQSVLFFAIQVSKAKRSCAFTEGSASLLGIRKTVFEKWHGNCLSGLVTEYPARPRKHQVPCPHR